MAARAISSGTISFGLVSIPVKLYTSAASEQISFHMLHDKCGGRVKMQFYCPVDQQVVERGDTVRGYEYSRGQYVRFTDEELKALEAERSNHIDIVEFVPLASVDFVHVEKSYYLGPDKGGDRAYQLLSEAMQRRGKVAIGRWAARGKEQLVLIRPYGERGLILHQLYYANEVRAFGEIDRGQPREFAGGELDLAEKLIEQLATDQFNAGRYRDSYGDRVREGVEKKVAGEEITAAPEQPQAQIIDLFEALKQSLDTSQGRSARKAPSADTEKPQAPSVKKAGPRKAAARSKKTG